MMLLLLLRCLRCDTLLEDSNCCLISILLHHYVGPDTASLLLLSVVQVVYTLCLLVGMYQLRLSGWVHDQGITVPLRVFLEYYVLIRLLLSRLRPVIS